MKKWFRGHSVAIGLAMFAMFFGAGNVVFPLRLGQEVGDQTLWAMLGLLITAVLVPFVGLVSVVLYDSDHKAFFGRIGKIPGYLLAVLILLLIGPFGGIPRTITLAYSTITLSLPGTELWLFSLIACVIVFFFAWKPSRIVELLGFVLTPLLLAALFVIIILGLISHPDAAHSALTGGEAFVHGLLEGYNTLDLLAACFFSSVVLEGLRHRVKPEENEDIMSLTHRRFTSLIKASALGAFLLAIIYLGLSFVSSYYQGELGGVSADQLLGAIAIHIIGPEAGIVSNIAVALACLTTAITLAAVFADTLSREICQGKIKYVPSLVLTLVVAYFICYLRFGGIVSAIAPVVTVCYPALIVLALLNLAYKLWNFKPIKIPVLVVFLLTLIWYVLV